MYYLLKLFPEITIKSRSVRRQMTRCLVGNIRNVLRPLGDSLRVQGGWDALKVLVPDDASPDWLRQLEGLLCRIPGIHEVQCVEEVPFVSFADTTERLLPVWRDAITGRTFRITVKRRGQHAFTSEDLERHLGRELLDAAPGSRVQLKSPDVDVRVDVVESRLRLVRQRWPGLGGYPLGLQGQALALISGGYDSPVAAWKMMRRGIKTHFLFFELGGTGHEAAVREVSAHLWETYGRSHRVKFFSVPFEGVVAELQRSIPDGLIGVVLKRMMVRAASRIATRARIPMLVTGDAIAQVSSQSLTNLVLIDDACEIPILRPLIAEDKQSIIDTARQIGTAPFAEGMPEVCGAVSQRPNTQARHDKVVAAEADFDFSVLEAAVELAVLTRSDQLLEPLPDSEPRLEVVTDLQDMAGASNVSVIDIRAPAEREAAPLKLDQVECLEIPFFELQSRAAALPDDRRYLLYCDQGVMSRMQAMHLHDRGLWHFGVYRAR
ncbi:tRNA 4-thiouridine(8) synthase ThiI [Halomonas sp. MCCC 1A17488]|uniref:tRNA uracil 4-sulfurtransferase ThiI n=1 Tax=unclassified Halomonas TaxID=2609666 RepID=UPI0018D23D65|nr:MULTISPECIES: tRNA uracil 4-sulfurtransferase ThiI [unclassified Halomonas]MCE8014912.1 tRNA 4-thiouridine(8) synthase ThiI [Halomonas sp. MCCC 1A17488]MCG3238245.1 tRNA 4-thiouridine(8) synthase ThiI [Halomonas sp. MCCC 1A17488]QPP47992.1 tRNA 4-thiouridine(8) synthase ThiI [Halomonas sp. SS10-MC5]